MEILGIDIGGSGIKGAIVDTDKGDFITERLRIATPQPSTPAAVAKVVAQISSHFDWRAPIGCTFPAVVKRGVTLSAANVDKGWIGMDAAALLGAETGNPVLVLNDADAAGIAEMRFGAGRGRGGWSSFSLWARVSAARSLWTARSCPIWKWGISSFAAKTPKPRLGTRS